MSSTVQAWEPLRHVGWFDDSGWMGPGTALGVDYYLPAKKGVTRVHLVQSAFARAARGAHAAPHQRAPAGEDATAPVLDSAAHAGWWLSVYDEALAKRLDAPARSAFRRVHEARSA